VGNAPPEAYDNQKQHGRRYGDYSVKAITVKVIHNTLEKAGIVFIDTNDGGPGARLRGNERR
jgi:hypothetical protein